MASQVVLITGCSSGIGKALCWAFHRQGCQVIPTARQIALLDEFKTVGMMPLPLDVTDQTAVCQVIETILTKVGRIDILVNNAGFGQFGPVLDVSPAQIQAQFQTNVLAPLVIVQHVAPVMKRQGAGLIVNMGSISGVITTPFAGAYCASKAALHSLSAALRMELAPFGITVITVQPGAIQSNFGQTAEQRLAQVILSDSWYASRLQSIRARATLSQVKATPVDAFAKQLVARITQPHPPTVLRLGRKSFWLPWLNQLLPTSLMEFFLKRRFGLLQQQGKERL